MPSGFINRTCGTVSAETQKEMTGLEFVRGLADGALPLNTIAQTLGMTSPRRRAGESSLLRNRKTST